MAALDGKITIGIDYRPCFVHISVKIEKREIRMVENQSKLSRKNKR